MLPSAKLVWHAQELLTNVAGLDVANPQETDTPMRFVQALTELTRREPFKFTVFDTPDGLDEMIIERDIPFHSLCRHHILPFVGVAHVGYIPNKLMPGLSKIARTVQFFAHALQTQEELTNEIAAHLVTNLTAQVDHGAEIGPTTYAPIGVAVVLEAEHMCMTLRGVLAPGTKTGTAKMHGVFSDHTKTAKAEFLSRINGK